MCVHIHGHVCNLIMQQLTDLHNKCLVISLNLSVVYSDVIAKQTHINIARTIVCVCIHDTVTSTTGTKPAVANKICSSYKRTRVCVMISAEVEHVLYSSSLSKGAEHATQGRKEKKKQKYEKQGEIVKEIVGEKQYGI